jgi:hypothetical protein
VQTNALIREECILKNKNKLCPYKKLSMFYNSCRKTFGSHLVYIDNSRAVSVNLNYIYIYINTRTHRMRNYQIVHALSIA